MTPAIFFIISQDDTFTERFDATVGVDFVRAVGGVDVSSVAQKIKTIELEQKKIKLQIVCSRSSSQALADHTIVGHGRPGALSHHHIRLL